jgi:hypothetical protein
MTHLSEAPHRRTRDERGATFPSPLVVLSIVAVAMAAIAFIATQDTGAGDGLETVSRPSTAPTSSSPTAAPTTAAPTKEAKPKKKTKPKPEFVRAETYVEVYNNSGISGLAGSTASRASGAGWNVVAADNWYGTIPASTVYYPERLKPAAKALAKDLGISRLLPAVDPMRFDRLTVILTSDYA